MNAIIVDDEPNARENLRKLLQRYHPEITIQAMADSVKAALEEVKKKSPDIVFLDVEMPRETGFSFLEKLPEINFDVIFVTAFDQYALKAFRFSAVDYILKPIEVDELKRAIDKVMNRKVKSDHRNVKTLVENKEAGANNKKLVLSLSDQFLFIEVKDIIRLEAEDYYTWFYISGRERVLISKNLGEYEEFLSEHNFFRVHKSHLINLNHISKMLKSDGGAVAMSDGSQVPISKVKKADFMRRINIM